MFRQNLAPERLKEILQKTEDKEADDKLEDRAGEEGKEEKEKSQDEADRTAGEDLGNIKLIKVLQDIKWNIGSHVKEP